MKHLSLALVILLCCGCSTLHAAGDHSGFLPDHFWGDLVAVFAFGLVGVVLIIFGYKVFDRLTPKCDFDEQIAKGNLSAGATVAAVVLGLCYVFAQIVSAVIN